MSGTSEQGLRSSAATPAEKLCRMLRSMLRRYPQAKLCITQDGFGVLLDANTCMQVSYTGRWTESDMRDCLALFATWCVADPGRILRGGIDISGVLQTVQQESAQSSTRQE